MGEEAQAREKELHEAQKSLLSTKQELMQVKSDNDQLRS